MSGWFFICRDIVAGAEFQADITIECALQPAVVAMNEIGALGEDKKQPQQGQHW